MTSLVPENLATLTEAALAVRSGETTSSELVSECLEQIETGDGQLRAFVSVQASQALARAAGGGFDFPPFLPPEGLVRDGHGMAHIRLDQALDHLIGDRLG